MNGEKHSIGRDEGEVGGEGVVVPRKESRRETYTALLAIRVMLIRSCHLRRLCRPISVGSE